MGRNLTQMFNKVFRFVKYVIPDFLRDQPGMLRVLFPWIIRHPRNLSSLAKLLKSYAESAKVRRLELKSGLMVPPFLIISITSKCNLRCAGCYAEATGVICNSKAKESLALNQWRKIIQEGKELGVFGFLIAGGEPFIIPNLLQLMEEFENRFFLIFTNGTILKDQDFYRLKQLKNTVLIVSLEGNQEITDLRRGLGTYKRAISTVRKLNDIGIFNGLSVTITRSNFIYWMDQRNIDNLISNGIRVGIFLEYIPVDNDTNLMLTKKEHRAFRKRILEYRKDKQIFLVHSPGDEEAMGGCVSAGRGFAHITPFGDLTPCPVVSDIATHNLMHSTLREGLNSPLFKVIRENQQLFETKGIPCALVAHQKEVYEIAARVLAYKTTDKTLQAAVFYNK